MLNYGQRIFTGCHVVQKQPSCFYVIRYFNQEAFTNNWSSNNKEKRCIKPYSSIPCPPRLPLIGHLYLFTKFGPHSFQKLYDAYEDLYHKYGPVVHLELGTSFIILFDPEDIQKLFNPFDLLPKRPVFEALRHCRLKRKNLTTSGLVTENDQEWQKLRKAVNFMMKPSFSQMYLPVHNEVADSFVTRIQHVKNSEDEIVDFLPEIYRYTAEAIGVVCFGIRLGLLNVENVEADSDSTLLIKATDDTLDAMASTLLGFPWWKFFRTPTYRKLERAQDFFFRFASNCSEAAIEKLKHAEYHKHPSLQFLHNLLENDNLTTDEVNLLMTEIFSAGIDSTGNTIGFVLYNIAKHEDIQEKLFKELQKNIPKDALITTAHLDKLVYLRACIKESYRLWPTSGGTARILKSPTVFSGFEVPENVLCVGLHPVLCRLSEYFEDPLSFKPERWIKQPDLKEQSQNVHPFCVLPFSHGVRRCVGQRIAEKEIQLCLIKILQNYYVQYNGPQLGCKTRLLLIPDKPLKFKFVKR